ncbi:MAG TPA: Gfo/Idh/MocA family oxidoreductase [Gemmataceae bacterium]|jgi:predicted dehydrogenase|nr:Gfo/Idh/MocA family oxidoreductase [Gemmataceae bacterium]
MTKSKVNRREFLQTSAAGSAALTMTAASAARVMGANDRIGIAFLGAGGRCNYAHVYNILKMKEEKKGVDPVAVCDVWDGNKEVGRGLYYTAEKLGLNVDDKTHVTKDYRQLLDLKEVDVVCVASPDHWHAKMSIDAAAAGKDVYCEKPMTKTIDEANAVVDAMKKYKRVMTVGVQSMADPTWLQANEFIKSGKIGHVAQGQTSYYRNSTEGQWRYYKLTKDMNPKTVDWKRFLGNDFHVIDGVPLGPVIPFDRAVYGQWRCYWPFGGGMFTDLFVHQTTHMISAMGVRYPARVVGAGGLYFEYDERDVPDVATVVADYHEGCQLSISATMINKYPVEEVIRGHLGTIKFVKGGFEFIAEDLRKGAPAVSARLEDRTTVSRQGEFIDCKSPQGTRDPETYALWENFLKCVRDRNFETLSTPELGAAAFSTVNMGVQSYRKGLALFWDKEGRKPVPADASWAEAWEQRSKRRGKPSQIMGWHGGEAGSLLTPEPYQKLGGAWIDGKDPAEGIASR